MPKQFINNHTNIVTKKQGEINDRNNFCRNTRIVRAKNVGKKSTEKIAKNVFLYSHEYRAEKMVGKKRAKQFLQKHTNSAFKNVGKKRSEKSANNVSIYSHEYRDLKKRGKKRAKQFFQKHTNSAYKKVGKKNVVKKCEKRFYIFTRISCRKNGGKKRA